jgi:hypothetical protein
MADLRMRPPAWGWLALAGVLIGLELVFLYQAMMADMAGLQRIFGVFAGLAIICFAALLYLVKVIFYD